MPRSPEAVAEPPPLPPPNTFLKKFNTRLDAPLGLPLANRDRLANLHASTLECLEDAEPIELLLQVVDPFLAVQVGHGHDAFDTFSAHTVHAFRAGFDAEALLFLGR